MKRFLSLVFATSIAHGEFYQTEKIPLPEGENVEVSSIVLMPKKQVAIANPRGEIWVGSGLYDDDLSQVTWSRFSKDLHGPLRMLGKGSSAPDVHGDTWTVHPLSQPTKNKTDWSGWAVRADVKGKMHPEVSGVSSPGGIGFNPQGDLFYTDKQGLWNGSSSLKWLKPGGFVGNPTGNIFAKKFGLPEPPNPKSGSRIQIEREKDPRIVPPAVVFPHAKVGQSPTAVVPDLSEGKFGPFAGQLLVGEQTDSEVQRVDLEMVNGFYQGAVFKFLDGYSSGIVPMRLAEDGSLFTGGTNRGWESRGEQPFSLERTRWKGGVPFEIRTMRVTPTGFKLTFTQPVEETLAGDPANYPMKAWTYIYQKSFGSPEVDEVTPKVTSAKVSKDKLSVEITVEGWVQGHVHHLDAKALKSAEGKPLWHADAYYTLNEIPFATKVESPSE